MDADRFDRLSRALRQGVTRRTLTSLLRVLTFGAPLALLGLADAAATGGKGKKKRRRKRKKSNTTTGTITPPPPGSPLPPPPATCTDGRKNGNDGRCPVMGESVTLELFPPRASA